MFGSDFADQGLLTILAYAGVLFLGAQMIQHSEHLRRAARVMAASGGFIALFGVFEALGVSSQPAAAASFYTARGSSMLGNPDMLGTFLVVSLVVSLGLAPGRGNWRGQAWVGVVAVIGASILFTQVRGAWMGALVGVAALAVVVWRAPSPEDGAGWVRWSGFAALSGAIPGEDR